MSYLYSHGNSYSRKIETENILASVKEQVQYLTMLLYSISSSLETELIIAK